MDFSIVWIIVAVAYALFALLIKKPSLLFAEIGVLTALILDLCNISIYVQVPAFVFLSGIGACFAAFILPNIICTREAEYNIESIVGEKCVVIERVDNFAGCGLVRVKGREWSAMALNGDDVYAVGESVKIVAIEGVKVICKK